MNQIQKENNAWKIAKLLINYRTRPFLQRRSLDLGYYVCQDPKCSSFRTKFSVDSKGVLRSKSSICDEVFFQKQLTAFSL